jgi:hypothetical protein
MGMEGREESLKAFRMVSLNDMPDSEPEICIAKDSLPGENSFVWPHSYESARLLCLLMSVNFSPVIVILPIFACRCEI